ncbi:MAG: phospholipase A [Bacteriovoracaceae bacterium]
MKYFFILIFFLSTGLLAEESRLTYYAHKPSYLINGSPDFKGQASFKYQLIKDFDLYLGSKNIIIWEISKASSPITDANYNPDFFYRLRTEKSWLESMDFGFFDHESNGRAGIESRSVNRNYIQLNHHFHLDQKELFITNNFFTSYHVDKETPDFRKYTGIFESTLRLTHLASFLAYDELMFRFFFGGKYSTDPSKGGQEISYLFKFKNFRFEPDFMIQYYHGYKESMLSYNQSHDSVRFGIVLK